MITNDTGFEKSNRVGKFYVKSSSLELWNRFFSSDVDILDSLEEDNGKHLITGQSLYFEELPEGAEVPLYDFVLEFSISSGQVRRFSRRRAPPTIEKQILDKIGDVYE